MGENLEESLATQLRVTEALRGACYDPHGHKVGLQQPQPQNIRNEVPPERQLGSPTRDPDVS